VSWLQIELRATPAALPVLEDTLYQCAAVSITLLSDAEEPVLEPNPGETPLWSSVRVQALFDVNADMAALKLALADIDPELCRELSVEFVSPTDWQAAARTHAVNQVFAERLWLMPKEDRDVPDLEAEASARASKSELVRLYLEPGLAFGSGSHPTTRLCLAWLAANIQSGQRVLDFGCGSGVLGIAAALLGATVIAVDHDDQAIMATRENAAYNDLSETELTAYSLEAWQGRLTSEGCDIVVANILAAPLQSLAAEFERVVRPGGAIVLSGVLQDQAQAVMDSYCGTTFEAPTIEAGWACLIGTTQVV
jgi:ribosomal protein L11 methyltransferase